jgi:hypothetical protein
LTSSYKRVLLKEVKQKGFAHLILIVIVLIAAVLGGFYYLQNNKKEKATVSKVISNPKTQNSVEVIPESPKPGSLTATYKNSKYSYSFDYPKDYHVYISEPDYVFVKKAKEDTKLVFDLGIKHDLELVYPDPTHYESKIFNLKNTQFEEYAAKVVYVECAILDVDQEYYCDRINSQETYTNKDGVTGYKFYMNLVHASRDRNSKRETIAESNWGPIYILDLTDKNITDTRGLVVKPQLELNSDITAVDTELKKVLDSLKFN